MSIAILKKELKKRPRDEIIRAVSELSYEEIVSILYDWDFWARNNQIQPPGNWITWMILAGRGWGKTRTGAEWIRNRVEKEGARRIAIIAPTAADARDVMIEGESGLLNIFPENQKPIYEPSKRRITFHNGAIATTYSADEPERLRGPNHDTAWCDELCSWRYPAAYDMLMFGLRLGEPKAIITTTPKPTKLLKEIISNKSTVITRGTTYDNRENLAAAFFDRVISKYEGTRLGRQELNAEILEDTQGALWTRKIIDDNRVFELPILQRIVVGVDPAASTNESSNETGIIIGGIGLDGEGYILDDVSLKGSPAEWATNAIKAYHNWKADKVVAENNNGGDMVKFTLNTIDKTVPVRMVHAARGKATRAEPISALYEQGKIHHVGCLGTLEDQMTTWVPSIGESPDRIDALVWAMWELMIDGSKTVKKVKPGSITSVSSWNP